jgi:hypothetical protein
MQGDPTVGRSGHGVRTQGFLLEVLGDLFVGDGLGDKSFHPVELCATLRTEQRPRHIFMMAIRTFDHETYSFFGDALSKARVP